MVSIMELKRHTLSVSEKLKSLYFLIACYVLFSICIFIYNIFLSKQSDVKHENIHEVIFSAANLQPIKSEHNKIIAPPPPPQKEQMSDIPNIVDKDTLVQTDTLIKKDDLLIGNSETTESTQQGQSTDGTISDGVGSEEGERFFAEKMPIFPGGNLGLIRFIAVNVKYPKIANERNIEGIVYIKFCVTSNGDVDKVSVASGVDPLLDREALRVIRNLPKWVPGEQEGKRVSVWFIVPINFRLK
jgi:protein TonB